MVRKRQHDRLADRRVQAALHQDGPSVEWWAIQDALHAWSPEDDADPSVTLDGWLAGAGVLTLAISRLDERGDPIVRSAVLTWFTPEPEFVTLVRWQQPGRGAPGFADRDEWTLYEYRHDETIQNGQPVPRDQTRHLVASSSAECDIRTAVELVCRQGCTELREAPPQAELRVSHSQCVLEFAEVEGGDHGPE